MDDGRDASNAGLWPANCWERAPAELALGSTGLEARRTGRRFSRDPDFTVEAAMASSVPYLFPEKDL
jgi:hypothetical protein